MATHSRASVGSLLASSYCERVNSAGKFIFNDSNSMLSPEEMNMLATLRMNKEFMEYMRENYSHIGKQQFNMTMLTPQGDAAVDI